MKKILLVLVVCFLASCSKSDKYSIELVKGIAIIEGKLSNFEDDSRVLSFSGNSILGDIYKTVIADSLGKFRVEIELTNSQDLFLFYDDNWATIYIGPNDSLFLDIDVNQFKQEKTHFEISGKSAVTSINIRDYSNFHRPYDFDPDLNDSMTAKGFMAELDKQLIAEDSMLTEFIREYNPSKEFILWAEKNVLYSIANNLLLFYWYFDVYHQQYRSEIFKCTDKYPVDDDSAIVSTRYLEHLNNYTMTYFKGDTLFDKCIEEEKYLYAYERILNNILVNEKSGISRDIILYSILKFSLLADSTKDFDSLFIFCKNDLENQVLVSDLLERKAEVDTRVGETKIVLDLKLNSGSETIKKFWKALAQKHKGKVIYLDIFATWCGPCRSEIPSAIELQNTFNEKPVAFVNLCLASNRPDWEKFLKENNIHGDNYFFNHDETALFRGELQFHGYPTYMIIDKNGNLVDKNAPRPSSGDEITNILNELLVK